LENFLIKINVMKKVIISLLTIASLSACNPNPGYQVMYGPSGQQQVMFYDHGQQMMMDYTMFMMLYNNGGMGNVYHQYHSYSTYTHPYNASYYRGWSSRSTNSGWRNSRVNTSSPTWKTTTTNTNNWKITNSTPSSWKGNTQPHPSGFTSWKSSNPSSSFRSTSSGYRRSR
jgi:hypothetical protein